MAKEFNVYKWRRDQINEEVDSPTTKKLKDITWEDVAGLSVPSADFITMKTMDDRDIFSNEWREETLNDWKQSLVKRFPNAMEFDIVINKNEPKWFNRVKINNPEYIKAAEEYSKNVQVDYEKNRGRYQGD
jgi:hypothetical protein